MLFIKAILMLNMQKSLFFELSYAFCYIYNINIS